MAPQPPATAPRSDAAAPSPSAPRAERASALPRFALGLLAGDRVAFTGLAASVHSTRPAEDGIPVAAPSPDVRQSDSTPPGASAGAGVGGSTGSSAASPMDLRSALALLLVGAWSLLVLALDSYRFNPFLALPERPG